MPAFLLRIPFVGREPELAHLSQAFAAAAAGEGALAFVVGEPGIGKTALCDHLVTQVRGAGGQALTGHCYEDGSLSLPYLPFIEALRAYVRDQEREALRREFGAAAPDLARVVPELRDLLGVEPSPPSDPESDRYRLLQAVISWLRAIAESRPLLLVLEDLHDADRGTLDLLLHLARNLAGAKLLVVGTYRDIEVDRSHPLSAALAELRRVASVGRVRLGGLAEEEARQVVSAIAGRPVSAAVARAVHHQTEGHALFVQEVARHLVDEGVLSDADDRMPAGDGATLARAIPEGLRDVIGKRLSRLSAGCNRLLGVAAVIGRDFDLATLATVAGESEDALVEALDEAVRAGVVEEREGPTGGIGGGAPDRRGGARPPLGWRGSPIGGQVHYRFTHALLRQALYEELRAPRRIRLHGQVARALETRHAARLDGHAAELAEHFSHSSDPADLTKAVTYGELAARRAGDVYAYREAAHLLEQALDVQEVLDPDDKARRCDLLLALGEALMPAGEPRRVVETIAPEALALAEALGDHLRAFHICQLALAALGRWGEGMVTGTPEFRDWAERAGRYADPGSHDGVRADLALANYYRNSGAFEAARPLALRALARARTLGDPAMLHRAAQAFINGIGMAPQHEGERYRLAAEVAGWPRAGVDTRTLGALLAFSGLVFLDWGERAQAEALWQEAGELATRTQDPSVVTHMMFVEGLRATVDGRLEEGVRSAVRLLAYSDEHGMVAMGQLHAGTAARRPLLYLGRGAETLAAFPPPGAGGAADFWWVDVLRGVCRTYLGQHEEGQRVLDRFLQEHRVDAAADETPTYMLVHLLEIAVQVEDRAAATLLAARLAPAAHVAVSALILTSVARQLGAAAVLLGRPEEARAYYQQALDVTEHIRFRPEAALTRLQLAELLLAHFPEEAAEAHAYLDIATGEFRAMGMRPALARAEALGAGAAGGSSGRAAAPEGRTDRPASIPGPATTRRVDTAPLPDHRPVPPATTVHDADAERRVPASGTAAPPSPPHAATPPSPPAERILATVLFTDIAASTEQVVALGDRRWRELKEQHHALVRAELARFRGREVDTAGDGFFAVFDAPARAVRCAGAIQAAVRGLGLELRAGLHLGEVEVDGAGGVTGIAVHIGARVAALAAAGEVLVSATVRDVAAGSELRFRERGHHALKGLPGEWALYRVEAGDQG